MFWDIFKNLCIENNTSPNGVAKTLGFSNAAATKWKSGSVPNATTVQKIADYFNVSVDYLLGKTDIKKDLAKNSEVEEGYYLIANRSKDGKQGTERLTKAEYDALVAVIKTLRHNTDEEL